MPIASGVLSILVALIATGSAAAKLQRNPRVMEAIASVNFPEDRIPLLAALELLGAAGLIIGIWVKPIGIAAAIGLVLYFLGALIAHLRVGDSHGARTPAGPLLFSIAALVLLILSV